MRSPPNAAAPARARARRRRAGPFLLFVLFLRFSPGVSGGGPPGNTRYGAETSSRTFVAATSNWFLHYMGKPAQCFENCESTIQAMERSLGIPARFEVIDRFEEFQGRVRDGSVDIGLLPVWEYLRMECREGVVPVVRPVAAREGASDSEEQAYFVIVRRESAVRDFRRLRGTRLVYRDRTALGLFSSLLLEPEGEKVDGFFKERIDVRHTRNDFEMVYYGKADAALITSFQWDQAFRNDPHFLGEFRKIAEFGAYPSTPIFARRGTPPEAIKKVEAFFMGLDGSEKGRALLAFWNFEKFVPARKSDYAALKAFYEKMGFDRCR